MHLQIIIIIIDQINQGINKINNVIQNKINQIENESKLENENGLDLQALVLNISEIKLVEEEVLATDLSFKFENNIQALLDETLDLFSDDEDESIKDLNETINEAASNLFLSDLVIEINDVILDGKELIKELATENIEELNLIN